jgi:hypothetical protein
MLRRWSNRVTIAAYVMSPSCQVGETRRHGLLLPSYTRCPFVADKALKLVAIAHVE